MIGNRIPYEYFITHGKGESDIDSEGLPYETGSYDVALTCAGIENANIVNYTSVIPTGAKEITKKEGLKRLQWGEVMECITAEANGHRDARISAGLMITSVTDPKGKYMGSFVCEYSGSGNKEQAQESLLHSIAGMIQRRGYGSANSLKMNHDNKTDKGYIIHPGIKFIYDYLHIKKKHGSVLVAICFVSYRIPLLKSLKSLKSAKKTLKRTSKSKKNYSAVLI